MGYLAKPVTCGKCQKLRDDEACVFRYANCSWWEKIFGAGAPDIICVKCYGHSLCDPWFRLAMEADTLTYEIRARLELDKEDHPLHCKLVPDLMDLIQE